MKALKILAFLLAIALFPVETTLALDETPLYQ